MDQPKTLKELVELCDAFVLSIDAVFNYASHNFQNEFYLRMANRFDLLTKQNRALAQDRYNPQHVLSTVFNIPVEQRGAKWLAFISNTYTPLVTPLIYAPNSCYWKQNPINRFQLGDMLADPEESK